MTKIKLILADQLLEWGFEQALTPSMICEITESRHGSCDPFGPTSLQPMCSPSVDTPRSLSEASDESTPVPPPSSQLAIHSSRAPHCSHGKRRNTITFGVGLSRPYTPSPAPLIKEEDSEPSTAPSPTDSHAPSKETFYDCNGVDYSSMTCHYCRGDSHHQIHCPPTSVVFAITMPLSISLPTVPNLKEHVSLQPNLDLDSSFPNWKPMKITWTLNMKQLRRELLLMIPTLLTFTWIWMTKVGDFRHWQEGNVTITYSFLTERFSSIPLCFYITLFPFHLLLFHFAAPSCSPYLWLTLTHFSQTFLSCTITLDPCLLPLPI
jgi:hypothetical protein